MITSLLIFNLIADSRLPQTFSLESLLHILTSPAIVENVGRVLDAYLAVYASKFADDAALLKEIEQVKECFDTKEKSIETFVDMLENTRLVTNDRDEYRYTLEELTPNKTPLKQEEDVLDTWFSSGLWPFSTLGWPEKTPDLGKYYPNDLLETGYDILFPWVARMLMMGLVNMEQAPFKNVYFHGLVRDEKGRKMSKSLGNIVDPLSVIEKYGADALRCSLVIGSTPGNDVNFSDTKTEYYFRFANKLWNAARFISMKVFGEEPQEVTIDIAALEKDITVNMEKLNHFDQWMLQKIAQVVADSERAFTQFQLGDYAHQVVQCMYADFCDWYIEISKREKSEYTNKVLLYALGVQLQLLHPFMPFVTEKLRQLMQYE
ncbi:MAG: class I tRNA ligase family protein [bacterium]